MTWIKILRDRWDNTKQNIGIKNDTLFKDSYILKLDLSVDICDRNTKINISKTAKYMGAIQYLHRYIHHAQRPLKSIINNRTD